MNRKNQEIFNILSDYGSFAKPFLNLMILKTKHDGWKHLFRSLEYSWKNERMKALAEIEQGLKHKNSKTLEYLLLAKKLSYLFYLRDYENLKRLYLYLKNNFIYIPKKSRRIVASVLINVENILEWEKNTRIWGKIYEANASTEVFIDIGKARKEIKNKNYSEAWKYFEKAYNISKKIPHRTGIISSLNNWSWYLKDFNLEKAQVLSKELIYYMGYYFEDSEKRFSIFDTFFEVNKNDITALYDYAPVINYYWNKLPDSGRRNSKGIYISMYNYLKKFIVNDKSTYENTEELRHYIKGYMANISDMAQKTGVSRKSLSAILNGKVKQIKGDTIRKIITGLNIVPDIYAPVAIVNEYGKLYIEEKFHKTIFELKEMHFEKRKKLFVDMYIACLNKPDFELNDIMDLKFNDSFYIKWFIIEMLKGNEFINARKKLINHFFENLKKSKYEKFVFKYFELNKGEKEMIDEFIKNYSRYDMKWKVRIELPEFLKSFVEKYTLKKMPISLAYWYYEKGSDRRKLLNILNKL